ncbi:MAG: flagellar hook protein FlgE [Myxococcota bacterium]
MGLISSMYAGVSGLETNSTDLSVIGDNIANANTIGFKASRAAFEEAMAQTLIGGSQVGLGSRVQAIQRLLTQGALTGTGLATDLAIQGPGFFVVRGSHNGVDAQYYTRAGQFTIDENGDLVNLEGLKVQGYLADAAGNITGTLGDLRVGSVSAPPSATTTITFKGNLDSNSPAVTAAWNAAAPEVLRADGSNAATANYNFSTSTTVYDSLGNAIPVDVYFRRTATGWEWHATTDGGNLTGGTAGTPTEIASGTLTFDTSGNLTASATTTNTFTPLGAVNPQPLAFDFGSGASGLTQYAGASAMSFLGQDGYAAGELARISIGADGTITGTFTNGQNRALGAVALADFEAPDQLERLGGNLFGERPGSGQPTIGRASTGGRGAILAGALEQSNVDLSNEFVRMITAQRGFQANSKTISTADQLLAELMNLKR